MKKTIAFALTTLVLSAATLSAAPRITSNDPLDYLTSANDLNRWSIGVDLRFVERGISINGTDQTLKPNQYMFYTGYDLARWVSIYGLLGYGDAKTEYGDREGEIAWGAGARFLLLDQLILGTMETVDRMRIIGNIALTSQGSEYQGEDINWMETTGSLTIGLINDIEGNKGLWFEGMGIYTGACYDNLRSSDFDTEGDSVGLIVGLELYVSTRMSVDVCYEFYGDDTAIGASFNISL